MKRRTTKPMAFSSRRGLAPLELVLGLPLMLFVMALMVNFAAVASWKVRNHAAGRYASDRTMYLRSGQNNPPPPMWPIDANLSGSSAAPANQVEPLWSGHPELTIAAVRGPTVSAPNSQGAIQVNDMLQMPQRVHDGRAPLSRRIPMLQGILPDNGRYRLDVAQNVLDGNWEFHHMGYGNNQSRRARRLYQTLDMFSMQLEAAYPGITAPFAQYADDILPLDADQDLMVLSLLPPKGGAQVISPDGDEMGPRAWAPDFYPRLSACLADPVELQQHVRYQTFLRQIERLPGTIARTHISWYQARIDYLEENGQAGSAEIDALQEMIDKLEEFRGNLPAENR